jgi:hypothetical protein
MTGTIDYAAAGPLTTISAAHAAALDGLPTTGFEICNLVRHLVIQPHDAKKLGVAEDRFAENQFRSTDSIVGALLALNPAPLTVAREPAQRVIGTCRHFAVLAGALLRYRGIPAKVRCGFGTYFQAGKGLDHWVTEYRENDRWVRIDPETLGSSVVPNPGDLAEGEFLTGGEAWIAFREGRIDAMQFGVPGTENFGPGEIRGNAIRDLACLNKVEMLPWDEWGRMTDSYQGKTGADYDELMDTLATVCAGNDEDAAAKLYASQDLTVPAALLP